MSTERSSSTVRNLRAKFEGSDPNAERPTSTTSERSSPGDRGRVSKIRTSFVSVERPTGIKSTSAGNTTTEMADPATEAHEVQEANSIPDVDGRRAGVSKDSTNSRDGAQNARNNIDAPEPAESTQATATEEPQPMTSPKATKVEEQGAPEIGTDTAKDAKAEVATKRGTDTRENNAEHLKAADPTAAKANAIASPQSKSIPKKVSHASLPRASAISGSPAGTPAKNAKEDTPTKARSIASKPSLTLHQAKLSDSPATKIASPKSPRRPTTSDSKSSAPSTPSKTSSKPLRSSLTAQTASSAARAKAATSEGAIGTATGSSAGTTTAAGTSTTAASKSLPVRSKPTPKSPTRPVRLSSHLMAPTASSAARHENAKPPSKTTTIASSRASMGDAKPPTHMAKSNLNRANSTATKSANRLSRTIHADEGFLARMTRPTASSSSRAHGHEKSEVKPATKTAAPSRPRAGTDSKSKAPVHKTDKEKIAAKPIENGHAKAGKDKTTTAEKGPSNGSRSTAQEASAPMANGDGTAESVDVGRDQDTTILDSSIAALDTPEVSEATIR